VRILVVGAGAIGGYFGGRLLAAGRDVTFLVRPARAAELARDGLVVKSTFGDLAVPKPPAILAEKIAGPFDLVLLSCKAYDLDSAIASFAPAVGPETVVLPVLNGMTHLAVLEQKFGPSRVLGGQCLIAVTLDAAKKVVHLNARHVLTFGERSGGTSGRIRAVARLLDGAGFDAVLSEQITLEMWEKWVFLATLAGMTCLMRASVGDIVASPGGEALTLALLEECRAIAESQGHVPRQAMLANARETLTAAGSTLTASMLRDVEGGSRTEAEHIIGELYRRRRAAGGERSVLGIAYAHLKAHEARRARLLKSAQDAV